MSIKLINGLTPSERKRKISVKEAAELNNISEDNFRKHYSHLIKQVSPRRQAVEFGDAADIGSHEEVA